MSLFREYNIVNNPSILNRREIWEHTYWVAYRRILNLLCVRGSEFRDLLCVRDSEFRANIALGWAWYAGGKLPSAFRRWLSAFCLVKGTPVVSLCLCHLVLCGCLCWCRIRTMVYILGSGIYS